jgi:hypothetical protein
LIPSHSRGVRKGVAKRDPDFFVSQLMKIQSPKKKDLLNGEIVKNMNDGIL